MEVSEAYRDELERDKFEILTECGAMVFDAKGNLTTLETAAAKTPISKFELVRESGY